MSSRDNAESASSTFSLSRPVYSSESSSSASSQEDPIAYRNARLFPPQFPAQSKSRPSSRTLATNRIAAWVHKYEKSQSPGRRRRRLSTHHHHHHHPQHHHYNHNHAHNQNHQLHKVDDESDDESQDDESEDDEEQDDSDDYDDDASMPVSSASAASDVSYAQVQLLWQQLKERRAKLGHVKRSMAKKRQELRSLRRRQDDADNALMTMLRPMLVSPRGLLHTSAQTLDSRMTAMQDLRDDYRSLESEYESLELTMDDEERELHRLETRFFTLLGAGQHHARTDYLGSDTGSASPSLLPYELTGISAHKPIEDVHPLYQQLTSTLGDLENARDDYQELLYVEEQYRHESDLGQSTGKRPTAEAQDFLVEFPAEEARMKSGLSALEADVARLKALCEAKGVMRKHMSVGMAYALDPYAKKPQHHDDIELEDTAAILARRQTLSHASFPELLSQPDHLLAEPDPLTPLQALAAAARLPDDDKEKRDRQILAAKEYAIDSLMRHDADINPDDTHGAGDDAVNRWLLQQLRTSPLSARLLHSVFVSSRCLRIRDAWRWQRDVLYYWWRDGTVRPRPVCHGPSSLGSSNSSRLGTPRMTRAASDGLVGRCEKHPARESDGAVTADG